MTQLLDLLRSLPIEAHALILGVVEGLTEFLPVSSTGHLIVTSWLLNFDPPGATAFKIAIQAGAVAAVVWLYWGKLWSALTSLSLGGHGQTSQPLASRLLGGGPQSLLPHLFIAFLPAAVLGLLFANAIERLLFKPIPVATALVIGGFVILWAERRQAAVSPRIQTVDQMRWTDALKIGFAQAFALVPGTSRSGATIIGGMFFGYSRLAATEFSFLLSVPTIGAATVYSLYRQWSEIRLEDLGLFGLGSITAFVSALVVVRWLIRFVSSHRFTGFAYYRIAFGLLVLITWQMGWIAWDEKF